MKNPLSLTLSSFLAVFISFGIACSNRPEYPAQQKPDWVVGESVKYSRKNFLVAVGEGDTRLDAENQARLGIARFFETKVESQVTEDSSYKGTSGTGQTNYQLDKTFASKTKMTTDQILSGVEISEYYRDNLGRHYALASLNRMNALGGLKEKIDTIDGKIESLMAMVTDKPVAEGLDLSKLKFYLQAAPLTAERELYAKQVSVLSGATSFYVPAKNYGHIAATLQQMLNGIAVKVEIGGEGSARIRDAVIESLNQSRFKVDPAFAGTPDILLKGEVLSQVVNRQDETWKWAKSEVVIDLIDGKNNQKFGQIRKSQREGSKDLRRARDLTLEKISEDLRGEVSEMVLQYLTKG